MTVRLRTIEKEQTLCATCRHGVTAEGRSAGGGPESIAMCAYLHRPIPLRVESCNSYANKHDQSIMEMRQVAWLLKTDGAKVIGFVHPRDLQKGDRWYPIPGEED